MSFASHPAALRWPTGALGAAVGTFGAAASFGLRLAVLAGVVGAGPACHRQTTVDVQVSLAVSGRIADRDGKPIAGAAIALTADPDDGRVPVASARTGAAGRFRMERVPVGRYLIRARAPGYVDSVTHLEVRPYGAPAVEIRLGPTVTLAGHIEDGRGQRVPLARVLAFAVAEVAAPVVRETRSDERGGFELKDLGPGAHRLLIEAPGLGTASAGPVVAPDANVVVVLPGEIRAIVGRVTRAGQPMSGARVLLGGELVPELRTQQTDASGRFVFGGLGPGSYALRAEVGGFVSTLSRQSMPERMPAQPRGVELALAPGQFARGRVVGQDGQSVGDATVQIDLVPATGLWPVLSTDGGGNWSSGPLAPGTYRVRARHPGFVARMTATVEIVAPGGPRPAAPSAKTAATGTAVDPGAVVLDLVRTGEIVGRVVDERGTPLAGATVHDRLAETEELGVIWSRLPLAAEAAALPRGAALPLAGAAGAARRATTDGEGRFRLGDVPPGRVRVEVLFPSAVPWRGAPLQLAAGGRLDVGDLRVQRATEVTGQVVDGDGRPQAGVRVAVTRANSSDPTAAVEGLYAVTASDGTFTLPLGAGDHRLAAAAGARGDASATVRVPAGGVAPPPITLRLTGGGGGAAGGVTVTLEGVVRDAEKRPLGGARIAARTTSPRVPSRAGDEAPLASAVADAGGAFRLSGLPVGPVRLEVEHARYPRYRRVVDAGAGAAGSRVDLQLPVPGGIDGEVHERVTGAPVPGFRVEARGPDDTEARFPESGGRRRERDPLRFSLRRLTPGRWTLQVRAPGYRPLERVVEVASAGSPGDPSVRDLRLELDR